MTKKNAWKQSIRADVAAALQSSKQVVAGPVAVTPTQTAKPEHKKQAPTAAAMQLDITPIRKDLARIAIVTGILFIALISVTVAQKKTDFLLKAYNQISRSGTQATG